MKLRRFTALLSAFAMLAGLCAVPVSAADPALEGEAFTPVAHKFTVDEQDYDLDESHAWKFDVPDANQTYKNQLYVNAAKDTKYKLTLYEDIDTDGTDDNNGMYVQIKNTNHDGNRQE